jgi:gluconolactonase
MVADVEGNLYVAERCEHRPGVSIYTADGQELAYISTSEELPTNVGFGRGEDSKVLYLTSGKSLYRITLAKDGYQLP